MHTEEKKITRLQLLIDKLDLEMIRILAERRKLILKMIDMKAGRPERAKGKKTETEILDKIIVSARKKKLDTLFITKLFSGIFEESARLNKVLPPAKPPRKEKEAAIALQGIEGSYSYLAGKKYFEKKGCGVKLFSKNRFDEVVDSVEKGEADFAVLPIENTTSGGINEVYDLLLNTSLSIIGEEIQRVNHCIAAVKKAPLKKIKKIYAHYQAESQCSRFLSSLPDCSIEYFPDTAMSFRKIKEEGNPYHAAIAGEGAARIYGLKILKTNIANQPDNYTRFIIAAREAVQIDKKVRSKTSIVMSISNTEGSLVSALSVFKKRRINLTRIESRPIKGNPWEEMFYIDFEGNFSQPQIQKLLGDVEPHTRFIKLLGSYEACEFVKV